MLKHLIHGAKCCKMKTGNSIPVSLAVRYFSAEATGEFLSPEWYRKMLPKLTRLSHLLRDVDLVDGLLVNVKDDSIIMNDRIERRMLTFKSLARVFIGSPSVQSMLRENPRSSSCFTKPNEREHMTIDSLTKISDHLNVSAQQRKVVRFTICPQVTQHRIWTRALEEILNGLKEEIDLVHAQCPGQGTRMGQQIVSSCFKFLGESEVSCDPDSTSWMRLVPSKAIDSPAPHKWDDVREMFNDLVNCLNNEQDLLYHLKKVEIMREGLSQIRSVLFDNSIGYKDARHHESLVQKKLSKTLGHSSRCLFTLLLYYLYGYVRDVEVDLRGGLHENNSENTFTLHMGRIMASDEEKMVWRGIKQLDKALGVFKFVWETAGMKGDLELQGHLWCVGAKGKSLNYRGNTFFVHDITLG